MRPKVSNSNSDRTRRPARDVIDAVLENMRTNLEPLKYSILAPSRYLIYLHPAEYARLEGIVVLLREETIRALSEEIAIRNRRRILGRRRPQVENPGGEWSIEFLPDPDGDIREGDILVDSELLLPANPELGVGERTRRVTTMRSGQETTSKKRVVSRSSDPMRGTSVAKIVFDDAAGHHSYEITNSVSIGRGGMAYPVDIKIVSSADVSREHARIRFDARTGRFFLIDLSALGTTLNGRHVPRGYDEAEGSKRENGNETLLPDQARIGLAETVYLNFSKVRS